MLRSDVERYRDIKDLNAKTDYGKNVAYIHFVNYLFKLLTGHFSRKTDKLRSFNDNNSIVLVIVYHKVNARSK